MADTRTKILDTAQELCQQLGHQGFSFRHIAQTLGIKSASVHHHFADKDALLRALVQRYSQDFFARFVELEKKSTTARATLTGLADEFALHMAERGRLCLCGMLAAEYEPLSPELRVALADFFSKTSSHLAQLLETGRRAGEFTFEGSPDIVARSILASFQGMLLSSRIAGGKEAFQEMSRWMISQILTLPQESSPQVFK